MIGTTQTTAQALGLNTESNVQTIAGQPKVVYSEGSFFSSSRWYLLAGLVAIGVVLYINKKF